MIMRKRLIRLSHLRSSSRGCTDILIMAKAAVVLRKVLAEGVRFQYDSFAVYAVYLRAFLRLSLYGCRTAENRGLNRIRAKGVLLFGVHPAAHLVCTELGCGGQLGVALLRRISTTPRHPRTTTTLGPARLSLSNGRSSDSRYLCGPQRRRNAHRNLFGRRKIDSVQQHDFSHQDALQASPKTETHYIFLHNFGNSAPILTILSLLQPELYVA